MHKVVIEPDKQTLLARCIQLRKEYPRECIEYRKISEQIAEIERVLDCPIGNIPVWVNTFDFRTRGY